MSKIRSILKNSNKWFISQCSLNTSVPINIPMFPNCQTKGLVTVRLIEEINNLIVRKTKWLLIMKCTCLCVYQHGKMPSITIRNVGDKCLSITGNMYSTKSLKGQLTKVKVSNSFESRVDNLPLYRSACISVTNLLD